MHKSQRMKWIIYVRKNSYFVSFIMENAVTNRTLFVVVLAISYISKDICIFLIFLMKILKKKN